MWKLKLAACLMFIGILVAVICALIMIVNQIQHPDMTKMRLIIEYKDTVIIGILGCITGYIGGVILHRSEV